MKAALPVEVVSFADTARRRLGQFGGAQFALRAEHDRSLRGQVGAALTDLGVDDVDVRGDLDEFLAGAQLCRVAGAVALPWPIVESLMRVDGKRLAIVDPADPRIDHGDIDAEWIGADLDGNAHLLQPGAPGRPKLGPFLVPAHRGAALPPIPSGDIARHLTLGAWRILGGLEAALSQVTAHVTVRKQFGQPLSGFQAVRFAVADAAVAVRGLDELAKYTSWRLTTAGAERALADATALRLHAVDTAVAVLRVCHQLLGAIGFCDEHDVSVLDRHLQPLLRLPASAEVLALRLVPAVRCGDFETLFS